MWMDTLLGKESLMLFSFCLLPSQCETILKGKNLPLKERQILSFKDRPTLETRIANGKLQKSFPFVKKVEKCCCIHVPNGTMAVYF